MIFAKKSVWGVFLVATLLLMNGCSYSFSQSTETSVGVDENGKIDATASTSVYTERIENGKTVNHQASASVGHKGASANAEKTASSPTEKGFAFTVEDADLRKGEAEIVGYFINDGPKPIKLGKVYLTFAFYDEKGGKIWEDETVIENYNLVVNSGAKAPADFVITNPNAPAFTGAFDLKYYVEYSE